MYWIAGMSPFDAISHSFSTVSIGGFSTHDQSIGYFNSGLINAVAVIFMLIAGINFTLHFIGWRSMSLNTYRKDSEVKAFVGVLVGLCVITCIYLGVKQTYDDPLDTLGHGIFQSVSIATTSGFTTTTYQDWPTFLPVLLIFASFIGACAGSTGGGLKVIRVVLLYKQGKREIKRLVHPNAIIQIKLGGKPVDESVINAVWGLLCSLRGRVRAAADIAPGHRPGPGHGILSSGRPASTTWGPAWARSAPITPGSTTYPNGCSALPCCWGGWKSSPCWC